MKTALILAGAITLVLISMESPAFGSPAPPNKAIASLMSDTLIDNEGLVRQKRGLIPFFSGSRGYKEDCRDGMDDCKFMLSCEICGDPYGRGRRTCCR